MLIGRPNYDNTQWYPAARDYVEQYGVDVELVMSVVRNPQRVEIDPHSIEAGHRILRHRRGDITVVVGYRDTSEPLIMSVKLNRPDEPMGHGSRRVGARGTIRAPRDMAEVRKVLEKMGCKLSLARNGHYNVFYGDIRLGQISHTPSDWRTPLKDYARMVRKIQEIKREQAHGEPRAGAEGAPVTASGAQAVDVGSRDDGNVVRDHDRAVDRVLVGSAVRGAVDDGGSRGSEGVGPGQDLQQDDGGRPDPQSESGLEGGDLQVRTAQRDKLEIVKSTNQMGRPRIPDEVVFADIRDAFELHKRLNPGAEYLTTATYMELKRPGAMTPAGMRLRYGSWKVTCSLAGVPSGPSTHAARSAKYSQDTLMNALDIYFTDPTTIGTRGDFRNYVSSQPDFPKFHVFIDQFGTWANTKQAYLDWRSKQ